jgi:hypothetical protein
MRVRAGNCGSAATTSTAASDWGRPYAPLLAPYTRRTTRRSAIGDAELIRLAAWRSRHVGSLRCVHVRGAYPRGVPTVVAPSSKVTECFETSPGQQAQFEWSPYAINLRGRAHARVVFRMLLG